MCGGWMGHSEPLGRTRLGLFRCEAIVASDGLADRARTFRRMTLEGDSPAMADAGLAPARPRPPGPFVTVVLGGLSLVVIAVSAWLATQPGAETSTTRGRGVRRSGGVQQGLHRSPLAHGRGRRCGDRRARRDHRLADRDPMADPRAHEATKLDRPDAADGQRATTSPNTHIDRTGDCTVSPTGTDPCDLADLRPSRDPR